MTKYISLSSNDDSYCCSDFTPLTPSNKPMSFAFNTPSAFPLQKLLEESLIHGGMFPSASMLRRSDQSNESDLKSRWVSPLDHNEFVLAVII